ncbi:MAG: UPF0182 family protein [Steroidobacteraceae bacterium]
MRAAPGSFPVTGDGTTARRPSLRHLTQVSLGVAVLLIVVLALVGGYLQKWLWMSQLGYAQVFWKLLSVKWALIFASFVVAFGYLWINLRDAVKRSRTYQRDTWARKIAPLSGVEASGHSDGDLLSPVVKPAAILISAGIALLIALPVGAQWDTYLRFRYGGPFGLADPLFGVDVGFYVFRLPFYELLQGSLLVLTIVTLGMALLAYVYFGLLGATNRKIVAAGDCISHLCALLAMVAAALGIGFYLDQYQLVYSTLGIVYGAGYTASHVTRIDLWIMVAVSAAGCVLLAVGVFRRPRFGALVRGSAGFVALYILAILIVPAVFQKLAVQPSELALETPYLKHYITFTRKAYQLANIQDIAYPALVDLTPAVIARNAETIQNVRLWDSRPLLQTYQQTQAIRLYYQFYNVSTGRYRLADGYHQVMLSTRELSPNLPAQAQTWVNRYLQFTHGSGLVMSFVSKSAPGGFPQYLIENVPAQSAYGLKITQPAVYYGASMSGYRIVDTRIKEFDYPKGNDNVYSSYKGTGGIPLDSFWRRLLFAWTQRDINLLLTSYITPSSRIQIWRQVQQRVAQIAPFLQLDSHPYPVLSAGKLYWIQDAYTTSDQFPYANPYRIDLGDSLNYIRNSVKVVVDMYDGSVRFYVMDPKDPVLAAYRRAFPGLFMDLDQLSPDLKRHLRYPEDLFAIQADEYQTFHMTDPQVFYNREDLWVPPNETYAGETQPMQPYYILMKLPGSTKLEYLLMMPFTPQNRDNMIAWMAVRCDFPGYGKILVYQLPKDKLVYGPSQIEAMINQNTTISQQLTLWDQSGSRVIRGKLIVIPIENSFLYVVPLYLTAEGTDFPQLKRVIVVAGNKVAMKPTLDEALDAVFGTPTPAPTAVQAVTPVERLTLEQARKLLDQARRAMQQGDWVAFGTAMQGLEHELSAPAPRRGP